MVLWFGQCEVLIYTHDYSRCSVARTQTEAAANDNRVDCLQFRSAVECLDNIEVERLSVASRLLCTVEDSNALYCLRHHCCKVFDRERTVEVNAYQAHLLASLCHVVDSLLYSLGSRAHNDDYAVGILGTVVCERSVFASCDSRNLLHVLCNDVGNSVVERVLALLVSEECLRVLSCTAYNRRRRAQSSVAELLYAVPVNERSNLLLLDKLDFLYLV